jgi:ABC-2 type transport system ATP-binding protein
MIKIENVSKTYNKTEALKNINLEIKNNDIFCLLGKNGAGKTTLISCILDLVEIDQGQIEILGQHHDELLETHKKKIGVAMDNLALIEEISGLDYLRFVGRIYKLPKDILENRIQDLFRYFFENEGDLDKNIGKYSTGMKKKIAFCAAVLHTPEILILDEPFSGLDPLVANQMVSFIQKYRRDDRLIFISSHDLTYVQKIATRIGVLDNSELIFNSTLDEFTKSGADALDSALLKILQPNESALDNIAWI